METANSIFYVGVNDRKIDLFEGQYAVPNGIAYNSYVIKDEKIAVMDSVGENFTEEWLENLAEVLQDRSPDYLIVQHVEPDHSANIFNFSIKYPSAEIVASQKAFEMLNNFFKTDFSDRRVIVGDGDTLNLGKRELKFITAPMVHWPEVIMTYDSYDKVLFSADAFGKFGALDTDEDWACEARRYYFGIVGKYGAQVQALLKKIGNFDIEAICPLHGPVLKEKLDYYIGLYNTWSSYGVESEGITIAYTSVYGNTKTAVELLEAELRARGCVKVAVNDLARCDMAEAAEDAFRYGKIVLATTTYNADVFPYMKTFIENLTEHNFQNRTVAFIENGSWAPMAAKHMRAALSEMKNMAVLDSQVTICSALSQKCCDDIATLADELTR